MTKTELKKMDDVFSEIIRRRAMQRVGGCEKCLHPKFDSTREDDSTYPAYMRLDCSHMHPKEERFVRWDIDNATGLCGACHRLIDNNAMKKVAFFTELLGDEQFTLLNARANQKVKVDVAAVWLYLNELLKELKEVKDEGHIETL